MSDGKPQGSELVRDTTALPQDRSGQRLLLQRPNQLSLEVHT